MRGAGLEPQPLRRGLVGARGIRQPDRRVAIGQRREDRGSGRNQRRRRRHARAERRTVPGSAKASHEAAEDRLGVEHGIGEAALDGRGSAGISPRPARA